MQIAAAAFGPALIVDSSRSMTDGCLVRAGVWNSFISREVGDSSVELGT